MNHRRLRIERGAHVRHRFQFLILDRDEFRRVLGHGAAGRHDGSDGFALPADAIDRDGMLRRRFRPFKCESTPTQGVMTPASSLPVTTAITPGIRRAAVASMLDDSCMRMRRTQEHHMPHARQFHIADVEPAALHQPIEIRPRHHLADIGIRSIELREPVGFADAEFMAVPPRRAVVSTASTMA